MGLILQTREHRYARVVAPPRDLAPYVQSLWISDNARSGPECRVIPDPCTEIILQFIPGLAPMRLSPSRLHRTYLV